jgi:hypothetical protein
MTIASLLESLMKEHWHETAMVVSEKAGEVKRAINVASKTLFIGHSCLDQIVLKRILRHSAKGLAYAGEST